MESSRGYSISSERVAKPSRIVVGGLHCDDFGYAFDQTPDGYVLVCFRLGSDGYHWEAIYEKAEERYL